MGNIMTDMFIAGLILSVTLFTLNGMLTQANTGEDGEPIQDTITGNLSSLERVDAFREQIEDTKNQVLQEGEVGTVASEASFFTNAFTVGKFVVTGGPILLIQDLIRDATNIIGLDPVVATLLTSIMFILLAFFVIKIITGR